MKRTYVQMTTVVILVALLSIPASVASGGGNANPGILPPNSRVQGLTYGEWSAQYWQDVAAIPCDENPLCGHFGPECYFARIGNVGLGVAGGGTVTLDCEMPAGMMLFVAVLGMECSTLEGPPFHGNNEEELRACNLQFPPHDLQASVDGVAVQNLSDYLVWSPLFEITVPEGNIFGVPAGSGYSVNYGTWLMIGPLTPGQHSVHLQGTYLPELDFGWDGTFHITVTPGR
jgi:hypothetical protein